MTAGATADTVSNGPDWSRVRMVILDRDDKFWIAAKSLFGQHGVGDVFCTTSPDEAIRYMRNGDVHVVLLGLRLNDAKGPDFLKRVRNPSLSPAPDIPILVTVTQGEQSAAIKSAAFGVDGVLVKPIADEELLSRVAASVLRPRHGIAPVSVGSPPPSPPAPEPQIVKAPEPRPVPPPPAPKVAPPPVAKTNPQPQTPRPKAREVAEPEPEEAPPKVAEGGLVDDAPPKLTKPKAKHSPHDWAKELAATKKKKVRRNTPKINVDEVLKEHLLWLKSHGAMGKRAVLEGADLSCCFLENANLTNADLKGADLSDANLTKANLNGADLRRANLQGAVLNDCNLGVTKLRHADFSLSHMHDTNLRGADLSGASFKGVNVNEADFAGAIFLDTDLCGADLSHAEGLSQSQCNRARADMSTKLPPGLTRKLEEKG